jgi:hypothetical protein
MSTNLTLFPGFRVEPLKRRGILVRGQEPSTERHTPSYAHGVRDRETSDAEPRLLAAVRWSIREHGGEPSSRQVDERLRDGEMDC